METFRSSKYSKPIVFTLVLIIIALASVFLIAKLAGSPEFNAATIESLDQKKDTVLKASLSAAAASTALTLIPGDTAMPIANEIAELSTYFIFILGAILLEKMLITVIGHVVFTYIIPFACVLGIIFIYSHQEIFRSMAIKLAIFGVVLYLAIPASIGVSEKIYESYESSVNQVIEKVEDNNTYIEDKKEELNAEDKNWFNKIGDYLSDLTSGVGDSINGMIKKGEESLSSFMDFIAVLIVTSCVIPIVVIIIFSWIIKIFFGFDSGVAFKSFNMKRK
jgi:hypothetical protein